MPSWTQEKPPPCRWELPLLRHPTVVTVKGKLRAGSLHRGVSGTFQILPLTFADAGEDMEPHQQPRFTFSQQDGGMLGRVTESAQTGCDYAGDGLRCAERDVRKSERLRIGIRIDCLRLSSVSVYIMVSPAANCAATSLSRKLPGNVGQPWWITM